MKAWRHREWIRWFRSSLLRNRACQGRQRNFRWSCWRARPITSSTAHSPIFLPSRRWSSRSCWRSAPRTPSAGTFMKAIGCGSSTVAGEVRLRAHVNGAVQPGVVAARLNAARFTPDGNSINVLTSETLTDIGGGATFYSCLVEVEAGAGTNGMRLSTPPEGRQAFAESRKSGPRSQKFAGIVRPKIRIPQNEVSKTPFSKMHDFPPK